MSARIVELNELNFEQEVLSATLPVLVHFWAGWSRSCEAMSPLLESIARDDSLPVKVARMNVERHESLVEHCGVRAVPTLLIFHQGEVEREMVGRVGERDIRNELELLGHAVQP
jgi:thioredoxin 1